MRTRSHSAVLWVVPALILAGLPARSDYVEELGAPALRWKPAAAPNWSVLRALPPLDMGDPPPATNAISTTLTNAPAPPHPSEFFGPFPEDANSPTAPMPGLPYRTDGMISPEWLSMMFYSPRTNGFGALVLPVPFVPPNPASRPSSATYTRLKP